MQRSPVLTKYDARVAEKHRGQVPRQQSLPQLNSRRRRPPRHRLLPQQGPFASAFLDCLIRFVLNKRATCFCSDTFCDKVKTYLSCDGNY